MKVFCVFSKILIFCVAICRHCREKIGKQPSQLVADVPSTTSENPFQVTVDISSLPSAKRSAESNKANVSKWIRVKEVIPTS